MLNLEQKQLVTPGQLESLLAHLVAQSLEIPASQLDSNTHLSCYGLDSVTAISAITAISDMTGLEYSENTLLEYPTISSLADYIRSQTRDSNDAVSEPDVRARLHNHMLQDSILPADIMPPAGKTSPGPAAMLLTGATGFLGIHLLDVLLANTEAHIYTLIRMPEDNKPYARLKDALAKYGIDARDLERRVTVIAGDLDKPQLGITDETFRRLAGSIDTIYHCAADVNWGLDYTILRNTNVLPVVDLLRLACLHKKKQFVFVSSISVCYAYRGTDSADEHTSALSLLENIHLGYAQSKVIAEALCQQAHARGLPVVIHRPALILGNSITGYSNNDDLVSRVIKGCIVMGCAPDLEWLVDACPVNEVAEAIYRLSRHEQAPLPVTHLIHSQPRYWRELVLWMNIYGYQIKLLPYSEWVNQLRDECNSISHPLYPLRSFFLHRLPEADGLALPEIYEEHRHSGIVATDTSAALSCMSLSYSPLDSALLQQYFGVFTATGFLPQTTAGTGKAVTGIDSVLDDRFFSTLAHKVFQNHDSRLACIERLPTPTDSSIITDLASWKFGKPSGLFRYRLQDETAHTCEVFIKVKPDDKAVLNVAATVAGLSVRGLDTLFSTFKRQTGLAGCHKRELAVYRQRDPRFVRHVPRPFLLVDNDVDQRWIIALEAIERPIFMDSRATARRWPYEHIISCINGLAELHSIWYGHESALVQTIPQCNALSADDMESAKPLWIAIAQHADSFVTSATGASMEAVCNNIIDSVHKWWRAIERLDRTLIHNDFNPRNMALVDRQGEPTLCAFDWELATLGIPQRDLAEFLCFALPPDHEKSESMKYIEHHRKMLERASGSAIEPAAWIYGFQLALFDLAISRIPMYTLVHRIRPQRFLRQMTQTWHALFKAYSDTGCL